MVLAVLPGCRRAGGCGGGVARHFCKARGRAAAVRNVAAAPGAMLMPIGRPQLAFQRRTSIWYRLSW